MADFGQPTDQAEGRPPALPKVRPDQCYETSPTTMWMNGSVSNISETTSVTRRPRWTSHLSC
jgi:hypothetical protein